MENSIQTNQEMEQEITKWVYEQENQNKEA